MTGVQVTEQSYTHRRLAECACVRARMRVCDGREREQLARVQSRAVEEVQSGWEELVRIWTPVMFLLLSL